MSTLSPTQISPPMCVPKVLVVEDLAGQCLGCGPPILADVADIAPIARGDKAIHGQTLLQHLRKDLAAPVERLARRDEIEHLRLQHIDAGIDRIGGHLAPTRLFQKAHHPSIGIGDDHAVVQRFGHMIEDDRGHRLLFFVKGDDLLQVEIGDGIAADHQKGVVKILPGVGNAARRAQGRLLDGIADTHAHGTAVSEVILNHAGHVLQRDDDFGDPVVAQKLQDVSEHHLVHQRQHRLGATHSQRAQPRACAACHHDSFHSGVSSR